MRGDGLLSFMRTSDGPLGDLLKRPTDCAFRGPPKGPVFSYLKFSPPSSAKSKREMKSPFANTPSNRADSVKSLACLRFLEKGLTKGNNRASLLL